MCFNWKVLAGLAVVGLGIYAAAPDLVVGALPLLLLLACPLSMLFMGKTMMGGQHSQQGRQPPATTTAAPVNAPLTGDEQLAQLQEQLRSVGEQQAALAAQVEQLEAAETPVRPVEGDRIVAEAEAIARDRTPRR